jgi:hypothetical protein
MLIRFMTAYHPFPAIIGCLIMASGNDYGTLRAIVLGDLLSCRRGGDVHAPSGRALEHNPVYRRAEQLRSMGSRITSQDKHSPVCRFNMPYQSTAQSLYRFYVHLAGAVLFSKLPPKSICTT